MSELDKFRDAILKTGFPLEYRVASLFQRHGWQVIQNKYYIDDTAGVPREIDILAYRSVKRAETQIYTTVIVSCKKDEANAWGFCTKARQSVDRNIDRHPLHAWTNSKVLKLFARASRVEDALRQGGEDAPFLRRAS